jgi:hypothetical protein
VRLLWEALEISLRHLSRPPGNLKIFAGMVSKRLLVLHQQCHETRFLFKDCLLYDLHSPHKDNHHLLSWVHQKSARLRLSPSLFKSNGTVEKNRNPGYPRYSKHRRVRCTLSMIDI